MANWKNKIILLLLGAGLVHISWLKWVNILVDYGRELYTPWQITLGAVLYKDISSLYGPLPPYWNALLFKIFGVSIMTLAAFNVLLAAGMTLLIYRFFSYATDKRTALFTSAAFLILFSFRQGNTFLDQGNFSYICPYTYSVTYAAFFSLCALEVFAAYSRSGKDFLLAAIGFLIGLIILCRFEIFLFFTIAVGLGLLFKGINEHWRGQQFLKTGGFILGGFFVPVAIAYVYFSTQLPSLQVWPDILGFNGTWFEILKVRYYQVTAGLDHPGHNFVIMLTTAACYGLAIIAFKCLCARRKIFVLLGMAGMAGLFWWILLFPYQEIFRGLPIVVIFMVGYLWKSRQSLPLLVMALWGLLMLTKVFLNTRVNSEGFVYAMPAVLLFIVFFQDMVPKYFESRYKVDFIRPLTSVLIMLVFLSGFKSMVHSYQLRQFCIQAGGDTIISREGSRESPRFLSIGEMAAFLKDADKIMGKDQGFVVIPEGIILNFLAKRTSPTPYIDFHSAELVRFGEKTMLDSLEKHKPDYIVWTHLFSPVKYPYAIEKWAWENYHPVWPQRPDISQRIIVYKRTDGCYNSKNCS